MNVPLTPMPRLGALPAYRAEPEAFDPVLAAGSVRVPAPAYTTRPSAFEASLALEAGYSPSAGLTPPYTPGHREPAAERALGVAAATCLAASSLVVLVLPALPGIVMVSVGHKRHEAALQWAGAAWLGCLGFWVLLQCCTRPQASPVPHQP